MSAFEDGFIDELEKIAAGRGVVGSLVGGAYEGSKGFPSLKTINATLGGKSPEGTKPYAAGKWMGKKLPLVGRVAESLERSGVPKWSTAQTKTIRSQVRGGIPAAKVLASVGKPGAQV